MRRHLEKRGVEHLHEVRPHHELLEVRYQDGGPEVGVLLILVDDNTVG
jgi:hypothetical protein